MHDGSPFEVNWEARSRGLRLVHIGTERTVRACRPLNVVQSGDAWRPGAGDRQLFSILLFQMPFSKCRSDQGKNSAVVPIVLWLKIQISVELVLATGYVPIRVCFGSVSQPSSCPEDCFLVLEFLIPYCLFSPNSSLPTCLVTSCPSSYPLSPSQGNFPPHFLARSPNYLLIWSHDIA